MTLNVDILKQHLNITFDADDFLLSQKLAAATSHAERLLGFSLAEEFGAEVPADLEEAILQLAAHWYSNREAVLVGVTAMDLPSGFADVINSHRNWSW
jgi:hypothetical protein